MQSPRGEVSSKRRAAYGASEDARREINMIRRLMASTAMLALVTAGAFSIAEAQDYTTDQPAVLEEPTTEQPAAAEEDTSGAAATTDVAAGEAEAALVPEEPTIASAFIGRSVFSSEDPESDNIGEVNDLIIGVDGMITHAVIGVGGFLGIGEKDVAVPFDELQVVEQDGDIRLIYASTREQLEAAEEFDRLAYDPAARAAEEQALQDQALAPDTGLAPPPAPLEEPAAPAEDMAAAPAEEPAAPAEEETAAAPAEEEPAATEDLAAAPAEEPAPAEEETAAAPAEEEPAATEDMAAAPAEEPAAPAEDMAAAPAEEPAAEEETAAAPAEEPAAPAEEEVAAGAETTMPAEGGFVTFSADQVRASTLIGQEVFGPDDQSIGEIADLVLQEDGETRAAIIDVGGFLGVGEKQVAIPFDQIEVSAEGEETRVMVALSQEELEQLPEFQAPEDIAATEQPEATAEQPEVAATEEQPAAEGEGAAMTGTGFEPVTQDLSAAELIGAPVLGSDDANLGEVGDVVFNADGMIEAVVIDVGGFLGVGEKPVALQFDSLTVQQDEGGSLQLMVNATQEQLEGAEAYQETAAQ